MHTYGGCPAWLFLGVERHVFTAGGDHCHTDEDSHTGKDAVVAPIREEDLGLIPFEMKTDADDRSPSSGITGRSSPVIATPSTRVGRLSIFAWNRHITAPPGITGASLLEYHCPELPDNHHLALPGYRPLESGASAPDVAGNPTLGIARASWPRTPKVPTPGTA